METLLQFPTLVLVVPKRWIGKLQVAYDENFPSFRTLNTDVIGEVVVTDEDDIKTSGRLLERVANLEQALRKCPFVIYRCDQTVTTQIVRMLLVLSPAGS